MKKFDVEESDDDLINVDYKKFKTKKNKLMNKKKR